MNYQQAIEFLQCLQMLGARPGLEATQHLAALTGNPHEKLRFIHVAGTNGKGSTCAMLESTYRHAGLRVGLFTSPHLVTFAERIQVNRRLIPEAEIVRLAGALQPLLNQLPTERPPTFFEAVTVMALQYFAKQRCDLVIWETGLGGRLDATNIVTPLASVVTNIGYDHQQWLGDTLEKIAAEKAGIIKSGVPVITAASPGHGLEVIADTARRLNAPLTIVDPDNASRITTPLPLLGEHQKLNAAVAVATVRALENQVPVNAAAQDEGLRSVWWPGRMQLAKTPGGQTVLLDGAHNADSAAALSIAFERQFPTTRPTLILGVLGDKDWAALAATLAPLAGRVLLVPVDSQRTLAPQELEPACRAANAATKPEVCVSLADALARAQTDEFLLITGSLYLVGEAMERLRLSPAPPADERALNEWGGVPKPVST